MTGGLNFTGWKRGTVGVVKLVNSSPRTWLIRCDRCGSEWTMPDRIVRNYVTSGGGRGTDIPCYLDACRMGRLRPAKITAHEQWLNSPEESKPAETPAEPVKEPMPERVSTDYLRYVAICRKIGQTDVRPWSEFRNFGDFLHKHVMAQVSAIEEKHGE